MGKAAVSINYALDLIKQPGNSFELVWVRSTDRPGKKKGSLKSCFCSYGSSVASDPKEAGSVQSIKDKKHVLNGTIPLTEKGTGKYLTPLISHLVKINGHPIRH